MDFEEPRTRYLQHFKKKAIALMNFDHITKMLLGILWKGTSKELTDLKRKRQASRFEERDSQKSITIIKGFLRQLWKLFGKISQSIFQSRLTFLLDC